MRAGKCGWSASRFSLRLLIAGVAGMSAVSAAACGSSGSRVSASGGSVARITDPSTVPASNSYFKNDNDKGDNDIVKGDEQELLSEYGGRPPAGEYNAIAAAIKRYMSVALAEDGRAACPMLYASFRGALVELHRPPTTSRRTAVQLCPALMTMEFKRHHSQLASYGLSTMVIVDAHVKNRFGVAMLGFKAAPEREILFAREGSNWKIDSIVDSELP